MQARPRRSRRLAGGGPRHRHTNRLWWWQPHTYDRFTHASMLSCACHTLRASAHAPQALFCFCLLLMLRRAYMLARAHMRAPRGIHTQNPSPADTSIGRKLRSDCFVRRVERGMRYGHAPHHPEDRSHKAGHRRYEDTQDTCSPSKRYSVLSTKGACT